MKRWGIPIVLLSVFLVFGCGRITDQSVSALQLERDGTLRVSSVSSFDKKYYDADELQKSINDTVNQYNKSVGKEKVALETCTVKDGVAKIVMLYRSADDYASFNNITFTASSLEEAINNGGIASTLTLTPVGSSGQSVTTDDQSESSNQSVSSDQPVSPDGSGVTAGELAGQSGKNYKVMIVSEPLLVRAPGKILYTSGNVSVDETGYARVSSADDSSTVLDAPVYIIYQ